MDLFKPGVARVPPVGKWVEYQKNRLNQLGKDIEAEMALIRYVEKNGTFPNGVPPPPPIPTPANGDMGMQSWFTHILEKTEPEWIVEDFFVLTGINRCSDTYDIIDTATIGYNGSLVQLEVNDKPIATLDWDISLFPQDAEHVFRLPYPILLSSNDRVNLTGGTNTTVRFALSGFFVQKLPVVERIPHLYIAKLDEGDTSYEIVIPSYMKNVCLHKVWAFERIKPSDSDSAFYLDYNGSLESEADGEYSGDWVANLEYYNIKTGQTHILKDNTYISYWAGTREFPMKMRDLYIQESTNLIVKVNTTTLTAGATLYKWLVFSGSYKR